MRSPGAAFEAFANLTLAGDRTSHAGHRKSLTRYRDGSPNETSNRLPSGGDAGATAPSTVSNAAGYQHRTKRKDDPLRHWNHCANVYAYAYVCV